jgi:hypothetical protein
VALVGGSAANSMTGSNAPAIRAQLAVMPAGFPRPLFPTHLPIAFERYRAVVTVNAGLGFYRVDFGGYVYKIAGPVPAYFLRGPASLLKSDIQGTRDGAFDPEDKHVLELHLRGMPVYELACHPVPPQYLCVLDWINHGYDYSVGSNTAAIGLPALEAFVSSASLVRPRSGSAPPAPPQGGRR